MNFNKVNLLMIAFRNIGRHKVKTFLTLLAIFLGISLYIFIDGLLLGAEIDSMRNLVNYEIGAAKIYSHAYFQKKDELPMYETFTGYRKIIDKLEQTGFNAAPRMIFTGQLFSSDKDQPFIFQGIDPELEKRTFRYHKHLESGEWLRDNEPTILLGASGARKLGVKTGDQVRLYTTIDRKDEIGRITHTHQIMDLRVAGLVNSPDPKTNSNIGFLSLSILQGDTGLLLDEAVTEIAIRNAQAADDDLPGKSESPAAILNALGNDLPSDLTVVGWEEDAKDYLAIAQTKRGGTAVILFLMFIITALLISNTMMLAVIERTKELGMMRAMGMTGRQIVLLLIMEGGVLGFIGSLAGIFGGILINLYMVNYGIDYTEMLKNMDMDDIGYRITGIFRSAWNFSTMITCFIAGILISMMAAVSPALRSIKKNVVEALRFE